MLKRTGAYTIEFENQPVIAGWGSVAGKKKPRGLSKNTLIKSFTTATTAVIPLNRRKVCFRERLLKGA